jgi:gliding motility-associated-like protein
LLKEPNHQGFPLLFEYFCVTLKNALKYLLFLCGCGFAGHAQLLVSPNGNAFTLASQLVGSNVTITNEQINCPGSASGLFIANGSNIGLTNGILLTTGKVSNSMGQNNSDSKTECWDSNGSFNDPQLSSIEPQANYDGCVLEFDIKPICSVMQVKFVFGSEEYPEFVNGGFNDAFGFFIWGPNPLGGSYNGYNVARLPNGTQVSIDNINNGTSNTGPCVNCGSYVDNSGGATVQYDGFTQPIVASINVSPCSNYHFKIAIADAGDCQYDSGVFLEQGGISCPVSQVPTVASNTTAAMCDLNNGSASAVVNNYTGTATYVWTPGGQTSPTAMNLAPGNYTCVMTLQNPCPYTKTITATIPQNKGFTFTNTVNNIKCPQDVNGSATVTPSGGTAPYSYAWNTSPVQISPVASGLGLGEWICSITDANGCLKRDTVEMDASTTLDVKPTSSEALCNNPTGSAVSGVTGGVAPYTYLWSTIPAQVTNTATALIPGSYSVTVVDNDGCVKTATVAVKNFTPVITLQDSVVNTTCNQSNGSIYVTSTGGTAPYQYNWSGGQSTQNITGVMPGSYTVNVVDANNCPGRDIFVISNYSYLPLTSGKKDDKCDRHSGTANVTVMGGTPPLIYTWSNGQSAATATNLAGGTYSVQVTDAIGCTNGTVFTIGNTNDVFTGYAEMGPRDPQVDENFTIFFHPTSVWNLDFAGLSTGNILRDTANVLNIGSFGNYSITYYLTSDNGCKASYTYDFFVKDFMTIYFPNTFSPNEDEVNDTYKASGTLVKEFKMQIFDRWGEQVFSTDDITQGWDGKYRKGLAKEDVYVYKAWAKDFFGKQYDFAGHINLIR